MKETLGQFVTRIMKQKNLTIRDVEKRGKLTHSYVARTMKGKVKNPTLRIMVALAKGLDVNLYEVFKAASGQSPPEAIDPLLLLQVIQKAFLYPELLEVIEGWDKLPRKLQGALVHAVKQAEGKKKPDKKPRKKR
jgi:transcriptional regulator with XRE-family HTH domain